MEVPRDDMQKILIKLDKLVEGLKWVSPDACKEAMNIRNLVWYAMQPEESPNVGRPVHDGNA
jgi:hypothetical protein